MTTNKKLIEEAAKAMADGEHALGWPGHSEDEREWYRKDASLALAVFEKALTPTDDEREALLQVVAKARECTEGGCAEDRQIANDLWTAGFRRTAVPEPSDDGHLIFDCEHEKNSLYDRCEPCEKAERSEPQAEPSSEAPTPSAEVLSDWFTSSHGVAVAAVKPMTDRGPSVMVDGRVISPNDIAALIEFKAQGEPSDAQVQEALDAYHGVKAAPDWSGQRVEQMRAALRAASSATPPENREEQNR